MKPLAFAWAPAAIAMLKAGTPVCALKPGPRLNRILEVASALGVLPGHVLAIADHIDFGPTGEVVCYSSPVAKAPGPGSLDNNDQPTEPEQELRPSPAHQCSPRATTGRRHKSPGPKRGKPGRPSKGKTDPARK